MKVLKVDPKNPETHLIALAAKALEEGEVLIYPTDTVYGLGCALDGPVERVFELKKRDRINPLSIACLDLSMAEEYCFLSNEDKEFISGRLGGPYTFVLQKKPGVPDTVTGGLSSVGVRLIDHPVVEGILRILKKPIITTSANLSGNPSPASFEDVSVDADLGIDSGPCRVGRASTVYDVRKKKRLRSS